MSIVVKSGSQCTIKRGQVEKTVKIKLPFLMSPLVDCRTEESLYAVVRGTDDRNYCVSVRGLWVHPGRGFPDFILPKK